MSFWTFSDVSDVFEEGGPIAKPFIGEFGLRAKGGINKPSYYGFALLHQLGNERLANPSDNVIVTRGATGELVIAAWNLVDPDRHSTVRKIELVFHNVPANASVTLQRVDDEHGNVLPRYAAMGKPLDPTPAQVEQLNRETALSAAERTHLTGGKLELALEPNALVLVKVDR
jgi:xylan 1,4-beta-xylosidase